MSETTNLKLFKQDNPTTNTNNFDIEKTLNENWDASDKNSRKSGWNNCGIYSKRISDV